MSGSLQCALQSRSSNSLCLIPLLNVSKIIDNVVEKSSLYLNNLWISFPSGKLLNKKNISSVSILRFFGCKNVGLKDLRFTNHQTCIYSKKQKTQKSQTLCGTDWHRWIGFWFFWFFWVYAGLVTFHYQNFWFFWVYAGFVHFWHQNVDLFWVYAGLVNLKSLKPAYTQKKQTFW